MKICIEHLPWYTSSDDLKEICLPFGDVLSSTVKYDSDTHRSRGYGLTEMSEVDCNKAIKMLNGLSYNAYHLKVGIACG